MASPPPFRPLDGRGLLDGELELGEVVGVFGVRGEVRVHAHNRASDLLARPREVVVVAPDGRRYAARLSTRTGAGKRVIGQFEGLNDREQARDLKGWRYAVHRDRLPRLSGGEFYDWQVVDATVRVGDEDVGTVAEVQHTEAVDVLVVDAGDVRHFVPAISDVVVGMDLAAGVVHVDPDWWSAEDPS